MTGPLGTTRLDFRCPWSSSAWVSRRASGLWGPATQTELTLCRAEPTPDRPRLTQTYTTWFRRRTDPKWPRTNLNFLEVIQTMHWPTPTRKLPKTTERATKLHDEADTGLLDREIPTPPTPFNDRPDRPTHPNPGPLDTAMAGTHTHTHTNGLFTICLSLVHDIFDMSTSTSTYCWIYLLTNSGNLVEHSILFQVLFKIQYSDVCTFFAISCWKHNKMTLSYHFIHNLLILF